jgi:hypothetical protein
LKNQENKKKGQLHFKSILKYFKPIKTFGNIFHKIYWKLFFILKICKKISRQSMNIITHKTKDLHSFDLSSTFEIFSYDGGNYQNDNYYNIENIFNHNSNHCSLKPNNCLLILKFREECFSLSKIKISGTHNDQTIRSGFVKKIF